MKETTTSVERDKLSVFVSELLSSLQPKDSATVIALSGDLGAGKTTLVQTIAKELGVVETVTSPTFIIMKGYETTDTTWNTLIHMDAYRIEDTSELKPLHFTDLLANPKTLLCVEWGEKINDVLPGDTIWLELSNTADETTRTVRIRRPAVNG